MFYYGYGFDPTMIILIPAIIFAIYAEYRVNANFQKYSIVQNKRGYTGADVAKQLLLIAGINDVKVQAIPGKLTDHYNPTEKTLNLSQNVFSSTSLSAIGVAAHETGHAIQHNNEYFPLILRNTIVPLVSFSSKFATPLIIIGLIFSAGSTFLLDLGIILFSIVVVFQFITLPVEFNASRRAIKILRENNFVDESEIPGIKKVLSAAAFTYVAATLSSLMTLIRYIMISNNRRK